ncbi:MAG: alpha-amylase [Bacteroidales bacterium]|nr:alpha-amylase [Bacteroidales bacterium]
MRRAIFPLACVLVVALQAFSCKEKEPEIIQQTLTVSPTSLSFEPEDASAKLLNVSSNSAWSVASSANWINIDKSSGDGNGSVTVTVAANTGEDRSGTVTIKGMPSANVKAAADVTVQVSQRGKHVVTVVPAPASFDGNKRSSTTYQLLIYTFADSDGDGVGDFKGIQSKLDYLDGLGVTGIWLSPAHPTSSYHGYDVDDYSTVNPLFGTEEDFKALVDAAHAKGIKIYMDYVLNHSGRGTEWFKSLKADPAGSPYRDYYVVSKSPDADVAARLVDNYAGALSPGMGSWISLGDGNIGYKGRLHFKVDWTKSIKTVTVTETTEDAQKANASAKLWLYIGSVGNVGLYETSTNIFEITIDVDTSWGFLVRSSTTAWDGGTKYGAKAGKNVITFGEPLNLDTSTAADITFGAATYYFGSFGEYMPDINYGPYETASESPAFKAIAASADKWIKDFGVDGFRLDAVIWLYQAVIKANQSFLSQWYDHCNATYKAAGHDDDIFMVGEAWDGHSTEKQYYKGINSCFEFDYLWLVKATLDGDATGYVNAVNGYINDHKAIRPDAITSIFLSNHDQDRVAETLGKSVAKEKQAAALLLTTPGKPFIYQGEELGYWGTKAGGDEYVRGPIMWDKAGKDCAKKGVNNKVNNAMLTASISVEAQDAESGSVLNVYKTFSRLRNTYPALANGEMTNANLSGRSIASWYMTSSDGQKLLVIHNVAGSAKTTSVSDDMSKPIALLGTASYEGTNLTLGANSSVIFQLK